LPCKKNEINNEFYHQRSDYCEFLDSQGNQSAQDTVVTTDLLKALCDQVLVEKNEPSASLTWVDDETVEVTDIAGHAMHQFALRAEKLE